MYTESDRKPRGATMDAASFAARMTMLATLSRVRRASASRMSGKLNAQMIHIASFDLKD